MVQIHSQEYANRAAEVRRWLGEEARLRKEIKNLELDLADATARREMAFLAVVRLGEGW